MPAWLQRGGSWAHKWLWTYRRQTWPLGIAVALLILLPALLLLWKIIALLLSGGGFLFKLYILIAVIGTAIYRSVKGRMPPAWVVVTAICIPLFMWGFWVIKPEWYAEWRSSRYFMWMVMTAIGLSWLSTYPASAVANTARSALMLLMVVAVGIGAFKKGRPWVAEKLEAMSAPSGAASTSASSAAKYVVAEGKEVDVLVPHDGRLRLWYDTTQVVATTVQVGPRKYERLSLLPGIKQANVDACTYRIGTVPCTL